jgi:hypothetical protein
MGKDLPLVIVQEAGHDGCKKSCCGRRWILVVQFMASEPADECVLLPASRNVKHYALCCLLLCEILGFHHGAVKVFAVLGYYAVLVGSYFTANQCCILLL